MAAIQVVTPRGIDGGKVYDFRCPYPSGCGDPGGDSFSSTGWGRKEDAVERGKQHIAEHEKGEPMPELADFWAARGLTQATAGAPDWKF